MNKVMVFIFVCISLMLLFSQEIYAKLWDFNNKAQEKDWKTIAGTCEIDKDNSLKLSSPSGEALAIVGDTAWTDYTIVCKARLTEPGSFNNIAIAFRASDDGNNEYMLMFEGGRQQAEWWSKIAGTYTEIKVAPLDIDKKNWFNIKVVVSGKTFQGYYNGKLVNSIDDTSLKEGKIGVRVYGCTSNVDDFDVNGPGIPATSVEVFGKLTVTWGKLKNQTSK